MIDLSQQSNEFLHFRFFTNSFILHHSSSIIYHLIIYQASALIYHVIHHLSPSIYHLPCIMYTSAFISHPFAPSPQASGVIPEFSALGPRPSALGPQPSPHPSSLRFQLSGSCLRPQASDLMIMIMIMTMAPTPHFSLLTSHPSPLTPYLSSPRRHRTRFTIYPHPPPFTPHP